jgi:geranylgeranyl pyrophosphate synthase
MQYSFNTEKYNEIRNLVSDELYSIENNITDFYCGSDNLQEELSGLLKSKSKRIRPLLAMLYLKMYGCEITPVQIDIQSAVELIHNATLIHDDVIDNSSKRRNRETLHTKFDNSLAIVSGDFLLAAAIKKLLNADSLEIFKLFQKAIKNMCIGEVNQYFNKFKIPDFDEYINKCKYKTAELFMASLVSSAMVAGIDINSAKDFAKRFGITFQIRDDLLNIIENNPDKPTNNDIRDGIYTAPVIFAKGTENLDYGIEKTKELLDNYVSRVQKCLNKAPDNKYKQALISLAELLKI